MRESRESRGAGVADGQGAGDAAATVRRGGGPSNGAEDGRMTGSGTGGGRRRGTSNPSTWRTGSGDAAGLPGRDQADSFGEAGRSGGRSNGSGEAFVATTVGAGRPAIIGA